MATIASKNPYELLDLEPSQPAAVSAQKAKAPAAGAGGKSKQNQKAPLSANEQAFRDRKVGSQANQSRETKPDEEGRRNRTRGPRGGRAGGRPPRSDRQDRTGRDETEKAVGNAWGQTDGEHKLEDEQAAEKIAKKDAESGDFSPAAESGEEKEEEPVQLSYSAWLEKQTAEKASAGLGALAPREVSANITGTKIESKKSIEVSDAPAAAAGRARQNGRRKVLLDVDTRPAETPRANRPEGRGAPRGRGGPRGGRNNGNGNGRSENRGRPGRDQAGPNLGDADAFPRLGA